MKIFISGGAKNGKSMFAQQLAKKLSSPDHLWYLATMEPHDEEDWARIARHCKERDGWGFKTVEWGRNLLSHQEEMDSKGVYLVDSVTALLTNEMFGTMDGHYNAHAVEDVSQGLLALLKRADSVILVSDNIFADATTYDKMTEDFRKGLARIDRCLAEECDVVLEFSCGCPIFYKGEKLL